MTQNSHTENDGDRLLMVRNLLLAGMAAIFVILGLYMLAELLTDPRGQWILGFSIILALSAAVIVIIKFIKDGESQ